MNLYDLIISRRTIREFQKKTVSRELIEKFVNAGRLAPQSANIQPLEFIVVDDPDVCSKVFSLVRFAGYLKWNPSADKQPVAYVVILLNKELQSIKSGAFDVACASENICLAAWGEGVGSCIIGSFSEEKVRGLLSVPDKYNASLIVALGYPAHKSCVEEMKGDDVKYWRDKEGNFHVPKRSLKKLIHHNKFHI